MSGVCSKFKSKCPAKRELHAMTYGNNCAIALKRNKLEFPARIKSKVGMSNNFNHLSRSINSLKALSVVNNIGPSSKYNLNAPLKFLKTETWTTSSWVFIRLAVGFSHLADSDNLVLILSHLQWKNIFWHLRQTLLWVRTILKLSSIYIYSNFVTSEYSLELNVRVFSFFFFFCMFAVFFCHYLLIYLFYVKRHRF